MMSGSSQLEDTVSHEEFAEAAHRYLDAILACEHCWYQIGYTEATRAALLESDDTRGTGAPPREEVRYAVMEKDVVNVPPPPPDGPPPPDVPPPPPDVPPDVKVMAVPNVVPPVHKPRPHAMAVPNVPPVPLPHAMAVAKAPPAHSMAIATAIAALHVVGASADFYDQQAKKRRKLTSPFGGALMSSSGPVGSPPPVGQRCVVRGMAGVDPLSTWVSVLLVLAN